MTEIMVSRRDGVVTAPDGVKHRVYRGKTLADARHPVVQAYPQDWQPMEIQLPVDGSTASVPQDGPEAAEIDSLREELAEVEELAESRGAELQRLADGLVARGAVLPSEDDREPGWLVDFVFVELDTPAAIQAAAAGAPAPRPPRAAKRAARAGTDGD